MRTLATGVRRRCCTASGSSRWSVAFALGAVSIVAQLLGTEGAIAVDQPIGGKKLRLRNTAKLVVLSTDAGIDVSGSDPRCPSGGSALVMSDSVNSATFLLPCANWTASHAGTLKYRNADAPAGASAVKAVRVKNGQLKVIGKGLGDLSIPNGTGTIDVVLTLDGISHRYCMSFTGTGDGGRFVASDAPAGSCPSPAPCDATTGGSCWFLGDNHASCDVACAIAGRPYDSATETFAGSGGTDADCVAVLDALGVSAGPLTTSTSCVDGIGCIYAPTLGRARCAAPPTNSSSSGSLHRVCACQ